MQDVLIFQGLLGRNQDRRARFEKELYLQYQYFIGEGCRKYHLSYDDCFDAYSDTVLAAIHNIIGGRFDNQVSLKTYLFQIYHHKCVDLIRKVSNDKEKIHRSAIGPELLHCLPDTAKAAIERLIDVEMVAEMKEGLERIGERCREILLLYEDGYSDKEIAEIMAFSSPAVAKTTRLRCREKIKNFMTQNGQP
ncbi:sigma-70 family RNA polymerase sigma factor [Paraflavisolibacter sp. H34]|uniref:RNA polymerase sigma factor n=1 Tax=Huijunlia imazamoxiresistens TaxID=3127457 RepID=UPI0030194839